MDSVPPPHVLFSQAPLPALLLLFSFCFGLLWGSFFNVCIYRLPMGLSPNRPRRSFCFSCGTPIAWYDNVPLVSWLALGGRCRQCGARISFRYFAIEALTGLIFALIWWNVNNPAVLVERGGFSLSVLWYWGVAGFLIIGAMTDIDHWIIPDSITWGGMWTALAVALVFPLVAPHVMIAESGPFPAIRKVDLSDPFLTVGAFLGQSPDPEPAPRVWRRPGDRTKESGQPGAMPENRNGSRPNPGGEPAADAPKPRSFLWWEPFANAALGALVGYGMLWSIAVIGKLVFRREAMGGGDLKLFAFLGAVFGPFNVVILLFMSSMVGVVLGVGTMLWSSIRPPRGERLADVLAESSGSSATNRPGVDQPAIDQPVVDRPAAELSAKQEAPAESGADSEARSGSEPIADPAEKRRRAIGEYLIYARKRPVPRSVHHIPFGPSISLAAMILLIYYDPIHKALKAYLVPAFG